MNPPIPTRCLEDARTRGAVTVGITNESESAMARIAQYVIAVHAGREESVAATKTYTCQLLGLYLLAAALGGEVDVEFCAAFPIGCMPFSSLRSAPARSPSATRS